MFDQLKNIKGLMGLMGRTDELRQKYDEVQERLGRRTVEADAGAGAVRVIVNGKLELVRVELDQAMIQTLTRADGEATVEQEQDNRKMIEELIKSAVNEGLNRARALFQQELQSAASEMNLPGLEGMFQAGR
ncbi:MAG: YbaB/EbfC family nucleoid-associated protein [Phycisphaeraceae bacterium]|nr:YbaB/EbfC family nucleoid-associated protein [Phycisphaeraceae bacterium]